MVQAERTGGNSSKRISTVPNVRTRNSTPLTTSEPCNYVSRSPGTLVKHSVGGQTQEATRIERTVSFETGDLKPSY